MQTELTIPTTRPPPWHTMNRLGENKLFMMLPQYVTDTGWVEEPVVTALNRRLGI